MKPLHLFTLKQVVFLTVVGVLLVLLSTFISYAVYQYGSQQIKAQFQTVAIDRFNALESEVERNVNAVIAIQAHFLASEQVTRNEFRTFTNSFLNTSHSIQALEWIPRISHVDRTTYEAQVQQEGISGYSITEMAEQGKMLPAQKRAEYFPVHFVEPWESNQQVVGFDLASNASRKQALDQAREQQQLVVTDPITLIQETGQQKGFLVFAPVSQSLTRVTANQKSHTEIQGFALGVYRMGDLVAAAMERFQDSLVHINIDMVTDQGLSLLFEENKSRPIDRSALNFHREFSIGTKIWQVHIWPTIEFVQVYQSNQWKWVAASLVIVSVLLLLLLSSALLQRAKIQEEVNAKTQQLSTSYARLVRSDEEVMQLSRQHQENHARMSAIVETASEGIITINEQGTIESANPAAETIFQYQSKELKGRNVSMLMPSPFQEEHDRYLANYRDTGIAKIIGGIREVVGKRKNGEVFPLELSLSEVKLEGQRLFTGFVRDISERKQSEAERNALTKQLVDTSRRVGMADVATGVLHNVGNVLNSVNVAAGVVADTIRRSSVDKISRTAGMIQEHLHDVGHYLTQDPKGQQIPAYLKKLGDQMTQERKVMLGELRELAKNIEHIKEIISVQQSAAKSNSLEEPVLLAELMDQALSVNQTSLDKIQVAVVRDYMSISEIVVDRHQVLQVLVNVVSNAKYAMKDVSDRPRVLTVRLVEFEENNEAWVKFEVTDTGAGISSENLIRIFSQGFTTKKDGHGFGLHSGALSAKLMGGSFTVQSEGEEQGAAFTLTLPAKRREVGVA